MTSLIDFILHFDKHLADIISQYGSATYAFLFAIVFCETGVVFLPFLPGDSLLFATGAIAADPASGLDPLVLYILLTIAAILGDSVNYAIGRRVGARILDWNLPFVKKEYIDRANEFYAKHGAKMIVMARFVPIVRTFAPFVAGMAEMNYRVFVTYNVVGAFIWTTLFIWAGYFFGGLPFVQENFEIVAVAIVLLSVLPMIYEAIVHRREQAAKAAQK